MSLALTQEFIEVKKSDAKRQLVYGIVYAPDLIDAHGDIMLKEEVEKMAHGFLSKGEFNFDIDHDNWPTGCRPVESFIARAGDPDFPEGSWVIGVKIDDAGIWAKVEKGEINGFSFQGKVWKTEALVEIEFNPIILGTTEPAEDGHVHVFVVKADENGKPVWGETSPGPDGHVHTITRGTATGETDGHKHRLNLKLVG